MAAPGGGSGRGPWGAQRDIAREEQRSRPRIYSMVHEGLLQTARCTKDQGAWGLHSLTGLITPLHHTWGSGESPPFPPCLAGSWGGASPAPLPRPMEFSTLRRRAGSRWPRPLRARRPRSPAPLPGVPCGGKMAAAMAAGLSRLGRGVRGLCGPLNGAGAEEPCEKRRGGLRGAVGMGSAVEPRGRSGGEGVVVSEGSGMGRAAGPGHLPFSPHSPASLSSIPFFPPFPSLFSCFPSCLPTPSFPFPPFPFSPRSLGCGFPLPARFFVRR